MAVAPKLDYTEARSRIHDLKLKFEELCAEAKENGGDAEETETIKRISAKIAEAVRKSSSPATKDDGEADWDRIEPQLEELREIVDRLTLAGHGAATSLFNQYSETLEARTEERWDDAVSLLEDALALARKVIDELDDDQPDCEPSDDPAEEEWNSLSGILAELKAIIDELRDRGDRMCDGFQSRYDEILEARDDARWQDAIDLLQNAIDLARQYMEQLRDIPPDEVLAEWVIEATVRDADGNAVPGVEVRLDGPAGMVMPADRSGVARFTVTGPGRYTVQAFRDGGQSQSETIDAPDPQEGEVVGADLILEAVTPGEEVASWGINAIVTDAEGNRVQGAEVRLNGPTSMSMATDRNGEAVFDIRGPGRYMVQAFQDDSESNPEVFNETDPAEGVILDAELRLQGAPTEPFVAPTEVNEPTLRRGDEDADGWVEYLQKMLNQHLGEGGQSSITVSGTFDQATDAAVRWFQGATECKVDGIVGNQTWSALREDHVRDAIGTDGRDPGTHSEQGAEARWSMESGRIAIYDETLDSLRFSIASTGTEPIDDFKADIFVDGARQQVTIGRPASESAGQAIHVLLVTRFRERFGDGPFQIEAYLPQELGGDLWSNTVEIPGRDGPGPDPDVRWTIDAIVRDTDGNPVPQAAVEFDGPVGFNGMTDGAGRISHTVQGGGRYAMTASLDGTDSDTQVVDESSPEEGMIREVELTIDLTGGDRPELDPDVRWTIDALVRDSDGNPITQAAVEFDGPIGFNGMTDGAGRISHTVQGGGRYSVTASLDGIDSDTQVVNESSPDEGMIREVELTIDLTGGDRPELDPDVRWTIDAIVRDTDGNPVPQAAVDFEGPIGFTGLTDGSGRVSHTVQGGGRYAVKAILDDTESDVQVIDEPSPPEGMVRDVELTVERETQEDKGNPLLADVEIEIGNDLYGSITVVFDKDGKFTGIDLKRAFAEKSLKGGAEGLIAGGKVALEAVLEGRMTGSKLEIKSLITASGSIMVGVGVASPKAWLGAGVEFGLKFSRTIETLTVDFERSVLENAAKIIKAGGKQPTLNAVFDLPAKYVLAGKVSLKGGGGSGSFLEGSISKTLKNYDPMIEIEVALAGATLTIELKACPGIYEFLDDIADFTKPPILKIVDEILEIADDPDRYVSDKRDKVEEVVEQISELPRELENHFSDEIKLIRELLGS